MVNISSGTTGRVGVLLINLGTPEATDYLSIRRYLQEFLSDRRVVELPRIIWWPVLNGIILTFRPSKSAKAYKSIWNNELNESPLKSITRAQSDALGIRLGRAHQGLVVKWAMRYGRPSIEAGIKGLMREGAERILLVPLYPQYSATTTATVFDKAAEALAKMRAQPAVRTLPPFPDDVAYINALAASINRQFETLDPRPDDLLLSFHGLPVSYVEKGDPYRDHCLLTADMLKKALRWPDQHFHVSFQSRVGRTEWLTPYTDETIARLAKDGVKTLAVATPGFIADCVETLEEIAIAGGELFHENGGEHFTCLECLNASDEGIDMLEKLIRRELSGWIGQVNSE